MIFRSALEVPLQNVPCLLITFRSEHSQQFPGLCRWWSARLHVLLYLPHPFSQGICQRRIEQTTRGVSVVSLGLLPFRSGQRTIFDFRAGANLCVFASLDPDSFVLAPVFLRLPLLPFVGDSGSRVGVKCRVHEQASSTKAARIPASASMLQVSAESRCHAIPVWASARSSQASKFTVSGRQRLGRKMGAKPGFLSANRGIVRE